jgi:hypothetical protein
MGLSGAAGVAPSPRGLVYHCRLALPSLPSSLSITLLTIITTLTTTTTATATAALHTITTHAAITELLAPSEYRHLVASINQSIRPPLTK